MHAIGDVPATKSACRFAIRDMERQVRYSEAAALGATTFDGANLRHETVAAECASEAGRLRAMLPWLPEAS